MNNNIDFLENYLKYLLIKKNINDKITIFDNKNNHDYKKNLKESIKNIRIKHDGLFANSSSERGGRISTNNMLSANIENDKILHGGLPNALSPEIIAVLNRICSLPSTAKSTPAPTAKAKSTPAPTAKAKPAPAPTSTTTTPIPTPKLPPKLIPSTPTIQIVHTILNPDIFPIIEMYNYKIDNYPQNDVDVEFKNLKFVPNNSACGKVAADYRPINNSDLASCDVLNNSNDNSILANFNKYSDYYNLLEHLYNNLYVKSKAKSNAPKRDFCNEFGYLLKINIVNIIQKYHYITYDVFANYNKIFKNPEKIFDANHDFDKYVFLKDLSLDENEVKKLSNNGGSYIQKIIINNDDKIILFGDLHGSGHTFVRHLLRLHYYGIINLDTFQILNNYKIAFLGDVIDAGNFSLEILTVICILINVNNNNIYNPKLIFIRGNHEVYDKNFQYGLKNETTVKCKPDNEIFNFCNAMMLCMPTAVVLNLEYSPSNKKILLSHGGFPKNGKLILNGLIQIKHVDIWKTDTNAKDEIMTSEFGEDKDYKKVNISIIMIILNLL
jgi:hypothetical protein